MRTLGHRATCALPATSHVVSGLRFIPRNCRIQSEAATQVPLGQPGHRALGDCGQIDDQQR
jgi:hypothetical protein